MYKDILKFRRCQSIRRTRTVFRATFYSLPNSLKFSPGISANRLPIAESMMTGASTHSLNALLHTVKDVQPLRTVPASLFRAAMCNHFDCHLTNSCLQQPPSCPPHSSQAIFESDESKSGIQGSRLSGYAALPSSQILSDTKETSWCSDYFLREFLTPKCATNLRAATLDKFPET